MATPQRIRSVYETVADDRHPPDSEIAQRVGRAIAELRASAGLSLSELARRSGLGKSTLSQLEAGKRNPTLDTLYAIATALQIPLAAILLAAGERRTAGVAVDALLVDRVDTSTRAIETYRIQIRPTEQRSRPHPAGTTETLLVLDGEVRVGPGSGPHRLTTGESATYAGDTDHHYAAHGSTATCILVITTPMGSGSQTPATG